MNRKLQHTLLALTATATVFTVLLVAGTPVDATVAVGRTDAPWTRDRRGVGWSSWSATVPASAAISVIPASCWRCRTSRSRRACAATGAEP